MAPALHDVVAYNTQILAVVVIAAAAAAVCGLPSPRARARYWRGVLLVCLLTPLVPVKRPVEPRGLADTTVGASEWKEPQASDLPSQPFATIFQSAVIPNGRSGLSTPSLVIPLLVSGAIARAAWLAFGLFGLRRLRRKSSVAELGPRLRALAADIAPAAEVRTSGGIRQPMTFGLIRPIVVVPPCFLLLEEETQRAVLSHELFHVRQRDWPRLIAEELLRCIFWFHPAVRWTLGRLQLSREEIVDSCAAAIVGRRVYAEALLMFASEAAPAPAIGLSGRRQLTRRIRSLLETRVISRPRLIAHVVFLALAIGTAAVEVLEAFPLTATASLWQSSPRSRPTVSKPIDARRDEPAPLPSTAAIPAPAAATRTVTARVRTNHAASPAPQPGLASPQNASREPLGVFENGRYRHVRTGITFDLPAGWTLLGTGDSSDGGEMAQFVEKATGEVLAVWMKPNVVGPAGILAQLRGAIPEKIGQRQGFQSYRVQPESIQFGAIGGAQTLKATADYTQNGISMSECLTWINSKTERAFVFARVPTANLAAFEPLFHEIAGSAIVP